MGLALNTLKVRPKFFIFPFSPLNSGNDIIFPVNLSTSLASTIFSPYISFVSKALFNFTSFFSPFIILLYIMQFLSFIYLTILLMKSILSVGLSFVSLVISFVRFLSESISSVSPTITHNSGG